MEYKSSYEILREKLQEENKISSLSEEETFKLFKKFHKEVMYDNLKNNLSNISDNTKDIKLFNLGL